MRRLFTAAFASMLLGVLSGLFYREFTKANDFPEGEFTQLGLVHTHLLVLGFVVLLLEKAFAPTESKLFGWFFWTYISGLVLTSAMMVWHGILTVVGEQSTAMISGIAGLGHILLSAGMVFLFLALRGRLFPRR